MLTTSNAAIDMSRMSRLHMERMANEDEDPNLREGITYPGKHDVMLGRGGESTYHCGNITFRQLVEDHKSKYYTCPRAHKSRVVAEVVKKWRQLTPPGRFLTRTNPGAGDKSPWHDVGDSRALKKASHSLRDAVRCFSVEKKQRAAEQKEQGEGAEFSRDEETTVPVDNENRSLAFGPDFFLSATRIGRRKLSQELEMRSSRKQQKILAVLAAPAFEERPVKRQRVVCDAREERRKDCRREGLAPKRQQIPRLPSPCGSADWFTADTEDLPVQASFALPTADILVKEVVVSASNRSRASPADAASDDENSVGWFTKGEPDMAAFTATPLFNVDPGMHRPVAVPSSRPSNGLEL